MKKITTFVFLLIVLIGVGIWYISSKEDKKLPSLSFVNSVTYICKDNKTINASYYKGETKIVKEGERPMPSGSVNLALSDGREIDLSQTISADGSRYANDDESFVFWSKGNGALVLENNVEKSYIGCIIVAKDTGGLSNIYLDSITGFSVRYPVGYLLNTSYKYQNLGPGKDISGVKFVIPDTLSLGSNLSSSDTGVSIEIIPVVSDCKANLFIDNNTEIKIITDNGTKYSFASVIQGAAGNRYEENIWAIIGTNPCIAVRYFIHYTNIDNYPKGKVVEFDRDSLIKIFDQIRQSLIIQ